jgi:hypothetical protein
MAKSKAPFPVRLPDLLFAKLRALAVRERRTTSDMARILLEDGVAAAEAASGALLPPAPTGPRGTAGA